MKICPNSPIPSIDTLLVAFHPILTWPPKLPKLPNLSSFLPGFKWPLLDHINMPNFELVMAAVETQMHQLQQTIMGIVKPILSKLGMALDKFLPKIPGLPDFNLIDLIEGKAEKLFDAVKAALLKGFRFPSIPWPLYISVKIPDIEVLHTLKLIVANYMAMVTNLIPDLIAKVTKLLKIPGLPELPTIPTLDEIMDKIKNKLLLIFPGIPNLTLPDPLFPSLKIPNVEQITAMLMHAVNNVLGVLQKLYDFCINKLAKFLSFSFPIFCITIPDITLPELPNLPDLPTLPELPTVGLPDVNIPTGIA